MKNIPKAMQAFLKGDEYKSKDEWVVKDTFGVFTYYYRGYAIATHYTRISEILPITINLQYGRAIENRIRLLIKIFGLYLDGKTVYRYLNVLRTNTTIVDGVKDTRYWAYLRPDKTIKTYKCELEVMAND